MKKRHYISLFLYTSLIMGLLVYHLLGLFELNWQTIWSDWDRLGKFIFFIFLLSLAFTCLGIFTVKIAQKRQTNRFKRSLHQIIQGQKMNRFNDSELDKELENLAYKLQRLTENVQQSENQVLEEREKIIESERRRIARDLHDTVSQELFAANMILSGVVAQVDKLSLEETAHQLQSVTNVLETAQKDLRILLLHLRPTELEGRTLIDGMTVILAEVKDKSELKVTFEHDVKQLPQLVEEHIFRIAQEIISNTLRHAKARHLEVYLYQTEYELQRRMVDDGVGFDPNQSDELSYGLTNIKERVKDMAGTLKILTAPKKGVVLDIRVPLLNKKEEEVK